MDESPQYARYRADSAALTAIGQHLDAQVKRVRVQIPRELAEHAIAAWNRDELGSLDRETPEQIRVRDHAASLALIGLVLSERGVLTGEEFTVDLDMTQVSSALLAAHEDSHAERPSD